MNLSEAALRSAVAKLLMEELAAADKETRTQAMALFLDAFTEMGMRSLQVRLPGGEHIANATLTQPKDSIDFDEAGFLAHVEADRPDEITKMVNPAYRTAIKRHLTIDDGEVVDVRTGEVVPWASVRPAGKPRSFAVVFTAEGRTAVKRAWQDDPAVLLEFLAPPALPAAPEPADDDMDAFLRARTGGA
jgi:hypothetical protein